MSSPGAQPFADNPIELMLHRLEGVKKSGGGWRALCPACGGSSDKLSVTEATSGAVLVRCFAGCEVTEVVHAVGLHISHLFPARVRPTTPEERRANHRAVVEAGWRAALSVLGKEAAVVAIAAGMVCRGEPLSVDDRDRLAVAMERIEDARMVFRGR